MLDIVTGIKRPTKYITITNRKEAIAYAIHHGEPEMSLFLQERDTRIIRKLKAKNIRWMSAS